MSNLKDVLPQEAINLEPLSRFKFRRVDMIADSMTAHLIWRVACGHRLMEEYIGTGPTLEDAIFDAGIDTDEDKPTHTD